MQAKITAIGAKAINHEEPLLIFFNDSATQLLKEYAIIQEFTQSEFVELDREDNIYFWDQEYTITSVGSKVLKELEELGHVSFFFGTPPKEELINAITLKEAQLPQLSVGMTITYKK